jgi:subtilisin family serine protease
MMLYSYSHAMHGFSARLTPSQLSELDNSPAHLATYPESYGKLLTTHSPQFLGLNGKSGIWPTASYGEGVIIGLLDTGIWPESESFNDRGMSSAPQRWKGKCETGPGFGPSSCNKKIIGARSFNKGLEAAGKNISADRKTPRDFNGHGTHTSSTAAGNHVVGASHFCYAKGTARGIAPRAWLAMYKVHDTNAILSSDVLAAMDQAIADGVDVLSLSFGLQPEPYFKDVVAIASLAAIKKGIVVVCAGGNDGPERNSTYNGAPWITTVGAGTLDRTFTATVTLENGLNLEGPSYFPQSVYISDTPLYYGKDDEKKAKCQDNALTINETAGKVVLCDGTDDIGSQMQELIRVNAYAGIFMADEITLSQEDYLSPVVVLSTSSGALVRDYVTGEINAKVRSIRFGLTNLRTKPAPQVADFSSRGPDPINPSILKPDVLAPGVDVLAAVPNISFVEVGGYGLVTDYALLSGTSMAAPHIAGVAALLKAVHPEWSPAAIRSAIMTTAYTFGNNANVLIDQSTLLSATPLEFGAGHVNPNRAMEPGLIYDTNIQDYIDFLCGLDYNEKQMRAALRQSKWKCSKESTTLNYPSFMAIFSNTTASPSIKRFTRVVTNVGADSAVYRVSLEIPSTMKVRVEPSLLEFAKKDQKRGFTVSVEIGKDAPEVAYGFLRWSDQHNHIVSSPIVAMNI